jgi:predicted membrane protein
MSLTKRVALSSEIVCNSLTIFLTQLVLLYFLLFLYFSVNSSLNIRQIIFKMLLLCNIVIMKINYILIGFVAISF